MPAVALKMELPPYKIDSSIPQYPLAGLVPVTGTYAMSPVYLDESVAPKSKEPPEEDSDAGT